MKFRTSNRRVYISSLIILTILLTNVANSIAFYSIERPITTTSGQINQGYLWAEETIINDDWVQHKGIDFTYGTGTNVYAVDAGTVVQIIEGHRNGDRLSDWGNFVLLRHDKRHYDRSAGLWGYVYSMYLHLSQNSVIPDTGDHVDRGDWIAQSDDTGSGSGGPHFHLQIVVHSLDNGLLEPPTLDANNKLRNPELWLREYNSNTARMVGKITYADGTAWPNLIICGAEKEYGEYVWVRTYSYDWANPDDYYGENFGTVDITPGTYHLYAYEYEYDDPAIECGDTPLIKDLGWYTFSQNQITFVGLYPTHLPVMYSAYAGWNSEITIRNNSPADTANIGTTFFYSNGEACFQRSDLIAPQDALSLQVSGCEEGSILSALVISSQETSIVVHNQHISGKDFSYTGISELDSLNPGWGKVGSILYAPVIMRNYYSWYSQLILRNTSPYNTASVTINYYSPSGTPTHSSFTIPPNGQYRTNHNSGATNTLYSAVVSSNVPLAAVINQYNSNNYKTYSALSSASTTVHVPVIMNAYYLWNTSVNIQNTAGSPANITIRYYYPNGSDAHPTPRTDTIPPYASRSYYSPNEGLPSPNFIGSAKITSDRNIAVIVNQSTVNNTRGSSYDGVFFGSDYIVIPDLLNHWGTEDWVSSVNVRNLSDTFSTNITAQG